MSKNVYVFLAEGFEEIEAITPIDILRRAECNVVTVSITGDKTVQGAHNVPLLADALFEEVDFSNADAIFLPGGLPGAHNLNAHEGLKQLILSLHAKGKIISAICAAPLVLGGLGILKGKEATCYPGFENELIGAITTGERCVVSDTIITGNGPGAAAKLGFALAAKLQSKQVADQWERGMMFLN